MINVQFWMGLALGLILAPHLLTTARAARVWWQEHRGQSTLVELRLRIPWHVGAFEVPRILREAAELAEQAEREGRNDS